MNSSIYSLTIGMFDGVHLGHQAILHALQGRSAVVTFLNHPQTILTGKAPHLLMFAKQRSDLLRHYVDDVFELPFTQELSRQSSRAFLEMIRQRYPFTHLFLGHDAVLGCHQEGTREKIQALSLQMGFTLTYLSAVIKEQAIVSSSLIRDVLAAGDLEKVASFLGRPYSICAPVVSGVGAGRAIGYPTINLSVEGLALPPLGVYAVSVFGKRGIANLGLAPTIHPNRGVRLEVHLLEQQEITPISEMEVVFHAYIRKEKTFDSIQALQQQIKADINKRMQLPH